MTKHLYTQTIDSAFDDTVGSNGVSRRRFDLWQRALTLTIPQLNDNLPDEAETIFALSERTDDLLEIEEVAASIANRFHTLVVVGMGGSSLSGETLACLAKPSRVKLRFVDNIDPHSIGSLVTTIDWRGTAFLVVSKSGRTLETLAQIAVLLRHAKQRLTDYARHFSIITVTNGNPLHTLAKAHGMRVIAHDPKLGGRFSVLSAVGLIPAAAAGLDIRALRMGACDVLKENFDGGETTPAVDSAALHMALIEKNIRMNVTMHYCDRLAGLASWYRQCWGESLGKCKMVSTPLRARGATDQHSQLQLYLDGPKDKFFTMLMLDCVGAGESIDYDGNNDIRLDLLKNRTLGDLMDAEQRATFETLVKNNCPVRCITLKKLNEATLGALLMHFSLEVIFTAKLLGINAFDQPAVEQGKTLALHYLAGSDEPLLRAVG
jgi:glucose-6-phosphate isomerase